MGPERLFAQQCQSQAVEPEQPLDHILLGLLQRRNGRLQGRQGGRHLLKVANCEQIIPDIFDQSQGFRISGIKEKSVFY